ncbi:MAG: hypothetical protein HY074_08955 [Deltaproteobacteria bacterium]|nr:hypothetical protein [Deltaproteobacteria bacterium]
MKFMRPTWPWKLLSIVALLPLLLASSLAQAFDALTFVGCDGQSGEYRVEFDGQVVLNKKFLAAGQPLAAQVQNAIRQQAKFLAGYFYSRQGAGQLRLVVSDDTLRVSSLRQREVKYPFELELGAVQHPDVRIDQPYMAAALKAGRTKKSDPGLQIHYRASVVAIACMPQGRKVPGTITIPIPSDPFLFYWNVRPQDRRPIRWRKSFFVVNPCADAEIADLPHPYYLWYVWDPRKTGTDDERREFRCARLLKSGRDYRDVRAKLSVLRRQDPNQGALALDRLPRSRPLKVTVLWGVLDPKSKVFPYQDFVKAFSPGPLPFDSKLASFMKTAGYTEELAGGAEHDRGSLYLTAFLRHLSMILVVSDYKAEAMAGGFLLHLSARLKQSGTALELRVFFGPTDLLSGAEPAHWPVLADALALDDIVLYNGHSGLGANTSVESLAGALQLNANETSRRLKGPPYQLVGYLSCFSYAYFGKDLLELRKKSGATGTMDVIYTGSDFTSERGPLGVLEFIDRNLAARRPRARDLLSSGYFRNEDFVVIKNTSY